MGPFVDALGAPASGDRRDQAPLAVGRLAAARCRPCC